MSIFLYSSGKILVRRKWCRLCKISCDEMSVLEMPIVLFLPDYGISWSEFLNDEKKNGFEYYSIFRPIFRKIRDLFKLTKSI